MCDKDNVYLKLLGQPRPRASDFLKTIATERKKGYANPFPTANKSLRLRFILGINLRAARLGPQAKVQTKENVKQPVILIPDLQLQHVLQLQVVQVL